jgi:hypothetical protein
VGRRRPEAGGGERIDAFEGDVGADGDHGGRVAPAVRRRPRAEVLALMAVGPDAESRSSESGL